MVRAAKIMLEANPGYRGVTWNFQADGDPRDKALVTEMKGKKMPQIGRVEISIIEEGPVAAGSRSSAGELDFLDVAGDVRAEALDEPASSSRSASKQGVSLYRGRRSQRSATRTSNAGIRSSAASRKEKIALRRAIVMGYRPRCRDPCHRARARRLQAQMPIPPGVVGHDPNYRRVNRYDPVLANKLLDYFGYKKGADGYRTLPDGKPLSIRQATGTARSTANTASCGRSRWMRSASA